MKLKIKLILLVLFIGGCTWILSKIHYEMRWNWATIDTSKSVFDQHFIFGVAGAAYQYLGSDNSPFSNWSSFKIKDKAAQEFGVTAGLSTDFWNHLDDDIAMMKEMDIKAFRFSFEWSDIEKMPGNYNEKALANYHVLFKKLRKAGIKAVMTLHHFTQPQWFEASGGFEKEENIQSFVRFCQRLLNEFNDEVWLWATFNEPAIYVTHGYLWSFWPPHKNEIKVAGIVLKNILKAHVQAYRAMKKMKPHAQIGFVHSVMQYDSYTPWNPLEQLACYYLNHIYHDCIIDFFAHGSFSFRVPFLVSQQFNDKDAGKTLDFFGINYYSHVLLKSSFDNKKDIISISYRPEEIKTDTDLCMYPEGLFRAIKDVSDRLTKKLHIPIYITENGIADAKDDRRALFIERYMYALYKAIKKGYDVRGYFYWSLLDNFEWHQGYSMKFGLYHVDFKTQKRTLRPGSQPFIDIINKTYGTEN